MQSPFPLRVCINTLLKSFGAALGLVSILGGSLFVILPVPAQAACAALPSDKGQATFSVSIPASGTYRVWTRLYPASLGQGRVQMQVDQTYCNVLIGQNSTLPANQFTWVDYGTSSTSKINLSLTPGGHTIVLAGVDPGAGVDKLLFLTDATCIPTGLGTNCSTVASATPVPVGGTTPQPTVTSTPRPAVSPSPIVVKPGNSSAPVVVSGIITLTPQTPTTDMTVYSVDGQPVSGDNLDTSKLTDGDHVIKQVTTDGSGKTTTTQKTIKVENGWQYQLVRGLQGHWQVISGIVLLLILIGGGMVYMLTHHLFGIGARNQLGDDIMVSSVTNETVNPSTVFTDSPTVLPVAGTQAAEVVPPVSVDNIPPDKL